MPCADWVLAVEKLGGSVTQPQNAPNLLRLAESMRLWIEGAEGQIGLKLLGLTNVRLLLHNETIPGTGKAAQYLLTSEGLKGADSPTGMSAVFSDRSTEMADASPMELLACVNADSNSLPASYVMPAILRTLDFVASEVRRGNLPRAQVSTLTLSW